ncbi:MAG TPA: bifunctional RNase H/acid phosphatase, partial [Frankiaceae bacterium]|nr:bifunctional RNase H/acid phosphatase [Frankiaceae bacterium]
MSRRLIVEADGGSRGNPGPAGYGALVRDAETGAVLAERAAALGRTTNNVAEYEGLIAGLRAAAEVAPDADLEVRMDSKLVVEQMSGRWQVRHPAIRPLAQTATELAAGFPQVRFRWVPRAGNTHADRLANAAMDAAAQGRAWEPAIPQAPDPTPRPAPTKNRLSGWMAPPAPPTTTVLLRHGQTALSVEKRFSGLGDAPLTPRGVAQARAVADRLRGARFDGVFCSPLRRTRQTTELLGRPYTVDEGLRETDFGAWEGLTFAEVRERWPEELS